MLMGNETISTYTRSNVAIWMVLAFQAGLLNMGGFMACHSFISHVTGFATLFGFQLNQGNIRHALGILMVPFFFLLGSMLSGWLVDLRIKLHKKPKYYLVFGLMFLLLLMIVVGGFNGFFGRFGSPLDETREYSLLAMLCLVCGIQNGTVSLVSRSVVRTTHLTGITTDLGIGLVRVMNARRLVGLVDDEWRANAMRVGIIFCFILGSASGYAMYAWLGFRGFVFPCAISGLLFFTTAWFQLLKPRVVGLGPSR